MQLGWKKTRFVFWKLQSFIKAGPLMGPTLTPLLSAQQSTNSHSARKGNEGSSSSFQPVLLLYLTNSSLQPAIGDTNQIFPISFFPADLCYYYCMWWGQQSFPEESCGIFVIFMLLLPRLISSSRQEGIAHWHRWSESVWYPTQATWTHLSAETHWTNFKEKDGKSQLFALFFEIECLGLPWLQHKKFFKSKSADMVQTGLCVTQCLANRNGQ